ncbi:hypothetical protein ACFC1T_08975 [Kitasatospora sp. NPDC056076]|uniref:hypothetical protein n=1 Tax=Kitasatospora sp. NPDC056076 TaxID=3345703 RepID=UPI0035DE6CE3
MSTPWDEDGDELEAADDWPTYYTPVPVWISSHPALTAQAVRMYVFLAEHIQQRAPGRRIACPSRKAIAKWLQLKDYRDVKRYDEELNRVGAVTTTEHRYAGGMRRAYRYRVAFNPPAGHSGYRSLSDFYERNPEVRAQPVEGRTRAALNPDTPDTAVHNADISAGQPGGGIFPTTGRGENPTAHGGPEPTARGGESPTAELNQGEPHQEDREEERASRASARGARSASPTGSRAPRRASGAASGAPATTKQPGKRLSAAVAAGLREVVAALPAPLYDASVVNHPLPKAPERVPVLRDAIVAELRERSSAQLAERVRRRWLAFGYDEKRFAGEELRAGVGIAVNLVRATRDGCGDPRCEDGTNIDLEVACRACAERRRDRRADGVPAPRPAGVEGGVSRWRCAGRDGQCGIPGYGAPPADGLCWDCRAELESVAEAFAAAGFVPDHVDGG